VTCHRRRWWPLEFYRSAVGKKYVMAVSGMVLMLYVIAHMVGNLKLFFGAQSLNAYSHWLRVIQRQAVEIPPAWTLVAIVLLGALFALLWAAYTLTLINRRARPSAYRSKRDYVAANFASRTMRWTGIIVALFVVWHLADLTWGFANGDFIRGDVYHNMIHSFRRVPVALLYIVANLGLGLHIFHGAWSLFAS